jgi:hypothetical protein
MFLVLKELSKEGYLRATGMLLVLKDLSKEGYLGDIGVVTVIGFSMTIL